MRILILNRFVLKSVPYREYIDDQHELAMITSPGAVSAGADDRRHELAGCEPVAVLEDYGTSAHVEQLAHRWHAQRPFDAVLAMSEFDLLTAARLRRAWGIAGQTVDSATAYRDKVVMKTTLSAVGVPVARFAAVDDATDLITFIDRVGLPVVVKPRRGASSAGVRVLRSDADVEEFLGAGSVVAGDVAADLIAEEYLPHEMYNVDGLVVDHKIAVAWPSWTSSGLCFLDGEGQIAASLDADEPYQKELVALTEKVVAALPTPRHMLFHTEIFRTADGRLVLNEIGGRIGGGRIWDQMRLSHEVDLIANYIKAMYGPPDSVQIAHDRPVTQAGWALICGEPGTVVSVPDESPDPAVWLYQPYVSVGERIEPPADVTDASAAVVVAGSRRADVEEGLHRAVKWFRDSLQIRSD